MPEPQQNHSLDFIKVNEIDRTYRKISESSFYSFVRGLIIPSASGPKLFELVMADFQREFFLDVMDSLHAVRDGDLPPKRRFWLERTKKTSKDNDVAICLLWLAAFTSRPILGQVCAANSDQAAIIEDRATAIMHYNPWLKDHVELVQRVIRSRHLPREVKIQIEATGTAGGAQGPTPDILILNELVHVDRWEVMKSHMNNAAGVPRGVVIVATNAGVKGTQAEVWRNNALSNRSRWSVHIWSKRAPWITEEDMADAKRLDPVGMEYARLWLGRWVSGSGNAVDEDSIDRCFRLSGPLTAPEQGWRYIAGLDLGVSHDHAGIVVLGVHEKEQRIKEVWMRGYAPSVPNDKGVLEVNCDDVEASCYKLARLFNIEYFGYDPAAGGSFMAQRLRKRGIPMREVTFGSSTTQTRMAVSFVTVMKDGKLECYEDDEGRMRRDFGKFNITHKPPSKYKLEAVSDEYGHADVGVSLVMVLPQAVEMLGGTIRLLPDDDISMDCGDALSDEEVVGMPRELREIYEMEEPEAGKHKKKKRPRISDDWYGSL